MKVTIVYGSRSGNTRQIAEVIAEVIAEALKPAAEVELQPVESAHFGSDTDLLIVGGPTEGHRLTPAVKEYLDRLPKLGGLQVAAFDTRVKWPMLLSGSAAHDIAVRLELAGGHLVVKPESFLVTMEPKLRPGERERASEWAATIASRVSELQPA